MKRINHYVVLVILFGAMISGCATAPKHPALQQADLPDLIPVRKFFLSGKEVLIYADQKVDVAGVVLSDLTKEPIWAFSSPDYPTDFNCSRSQ